MQIDESEIKITSASTSEKWPPMPTDKGVANADSTARVLEDANELRAVSLDSIEHDLRSPLTAIRAVSEVLIPQSAMTKREQGEMFAIVDKECRRLDGMLETTIRNPQFVPCAVRINRQPQKLRKLLNLVLRQTCPWLRQHKVRIRISEALPSVPMDDELVGRVLRPMLENAVGYSPPGSTIEISGQVEGERLVVIVADQ
jgi:two-component system sensor histidine kinase KdpD